jgi:hypothetical protein
MYQADQYNICLPLVNGKKQHDVSIARYRVEFKSDAAITFAGEFYVMAMMKLKAAGSAPDPDDISKCVLATSMSLLSLETALQKHNQQDFYPLCIPFLIGSGETARLYATYLHENGEPKVGLVCVKDMEFQEEEIEFIEALLILLRQVARAVASIPSSHWEYCQPQKETLKKQQNILPSKSRPSTSSNAHSSHQGRPPSQN